MSATILTADLQLDLAASFRVVGGLVREGLSERTHATVEIASVEDLDFRPLLTTEVVLEVSGIEDRKWTLRLGGAALLDEKDGSYRYQLDLYDAPWLLGFSKATRKYRNRSAQEIVTQLLDEHGVPYLWQLSGETPVRKYCAQYDETNLAFMERLLESEGIFYSFDQSGTMLLADTSTAAPRLDQSAPFELIASDQALDQGDVGIFELFRCAQVQSGGTTLADYSWKTPKVNLRESAFDEVDTDLERYEYPAGYRKPDQGQRLAKLRLEALRAEARRIEGQSTIPRFGPAVGFAFGGHTGKQFEGEFVLVHVEHRFRMGEFEALLPELAAIEGYANRFRAISRTVPYRPPLRAPRPTVHGSHTATVRGPAGEDIHTDTHGRFRAQLHWDREALGNDEDSRWFRKLQEVSTSMNLARTGWEMFITHIDGDPDRPIGLGRAINGEAVPVYSLPANMNVMAIKTPSSPATGGYNELSLDDTMDKQLFSLQMEKDYDALVKNDQGVTIGNNSLHNVGTDFDRQVTGNQSIAIGANSSGTVGEDQKINVQGNTSMTIGGTMEVKLASGSTIRIDCNDTEIVGGLRLTVAGSFAVPDLGAMAESAARTFAGRASPGAAALMERYEQLQNLPSSAQEVSDLALSKGQGYVDQLTGKAGDLAEQAGKDAGKAAWDALKEGWSDDDTDLGDAISGAAGSGWGSLEGSLDTGIDGMTSELQSIGTELQGLIPTQDKIGGYLDGLKKDFNSLLPTDKSIQAGAQEALSEMTGGLSESLTAGNWDLALQQSIDMFCTGGISRQAKYLTLKMVGGAYVIGSVGKTEWTAGKLYAETVGGVKLTGSIKNINQSVDGLHTVTVGGAMMLSAGTTISISAATSAISVGGSATISSDGPVNIKSSGAAVKLAGDGGLLAKGGGAKAQLSPGSITFTGALSLEADGDIIVIGGKADST